MSYAPAADAVLRILALLGTQAEPMPAAQLAATLELPRSTTYRLLGSLLEQGFVTYLDDDHRYGLGVVAYELGSSYSRQMPLRRLAQPALTRLVGRTRHNAHLAVLHGTDVYYVIEERASGRPPLVTDVGVRLPATVTASGLAILSALPAAQITALFPGPAGLVQRNDRGPVTPRELRQLLITVRRDGYATEVDSVTVGLSSIGVPVHDRSGHPVAAISITYPGDEVGKRPPARLIEETRHAATALSDRLRHAIPHRPSHRPSR